MKPSDIVLLNVPGRPAIAADGTVVVAVNRPDLDGDRYVGTLRAISPGFDRKLTFGPGDSAPLLSPDGVTVIFLRADGKAPAQLHSIDLRGGESRRLTSHPAGVGSVVFSTDGRRIAYLAPLPEAGRYGTDPEVGPEAEPPRGITRMSYRRDGKGFISDKPEQVFALELVEGAEPVRLTDEPSIVSGPAFLLDGRIAYVRSTTSDRLQSEFAVIPANPTPLDPADGSPAEGSPADASRPSAGELLATLRGNATQAVCKAGELYFLGAEFDGIDVAGRTTGLWSMAIDGSGIRRLTGLDVEVDTTTTPVVVGTCVLVTVLDRGTVSLRAVAQDADQAGLADLTPVLGGERVVTAFSAAVLDGTAGTPVIAVVAVVADPASPGEVVAGEIDLAGHPVGPERRLTDYAANLRTAGLAAHRELRAVSADGYPVHGFLVAPPGPGPHPVLLVVHGGPHAAYGWGLFDEAQVYAGAGYAVVLPNPRGSAGYGFEHGRAVLGRLGTIDADDVLALLGAALDFEECDAGRVGVMGGSYGGFLTSWLASHAPGPFTAAISERAVNAWDSFAGSSDIGFFFAENYVGAERDEQWRASPLAYADDISVPLLIVHSEHDWRCPLEQAQRLFVALKRRGAEVEMLLFPAEGHELSRSGRPQHRVQRFDAILRWWERYLPTVSGAPIPDEADSTPRGST